MALASLQLYKNPYSYPNYGSITAVGSAVPCTPKGTGFKTGTISVASRISNFNDCNYLALTRNGKTTYAWIEDVAVETDNSFTVSYRVDPWRTYRSSIDLGVQFIERSNQITYKRDSMLGATQAYPDIIETFHTIGSNRTRTLVVQEKIYAGEQLSNTPVQPTPHKFYFLEYNIDNWAANEALSAFIISITGGIKPENIVTLYSIPQIDISHLPTTDLIIQPGSVAIPGFKALHELTNMNGRLFTTTDIDIGTDIDELLRVDHSVQLVVPDAGIINIPDSILKEGNLKLRQDVDIFSGASNYMVTSGSKYYTQSIRGSSISSIPIISDPMDTYLSQNQNALITSLIGDVASIGAGIAIAGATGGLGAVVGSSTVISGINGIVSRQASIADMAGGASNPPAYLGTALASTFNQSFWVVVTKNPVDNASIVHSKYGYPLNKVVNLVFPTSGYIKTQGCDVSSDGTVPRWAIEEINQMFNNGVAVQ